jgi:hypothetical protein
MALIIRTVTSTSSSTIELFVPGYDTIKPQVSIAPSATLDLFTVLTAEELETIQNQLVELVALNDLVVVATVDPATFNPVAGATGTVNSAAANKLAYYAATGTTVSGLTAITASKALASDANGLPVASTTTAAELGYVSGVTSAIQTQLNSKAPVASTPSIVAAVDLTAVAADATAVLVTPSVSGMFNISVYAVCTASATGGDVAPTLLVSWTDESGFNQNYFATPLNSGATTINYGSFPVWDVATNPISYNITGGTYSSTLRYDIHFVVEKI